MSVKKVFWRDCEQGKDAVKTHAPVFAIGGERYPATVISDSRHVAENARLRS